MVSPSQPMPDREPHASVPRPRLPARRIRLFEEVRFRLADPRVGAVVLGLIALVAGAAWYLASSRSAEPEASIASVDERVTGSEHEDVPADSEGAGPVTVHVAGAVASPGVIELAAGSRVIDAIEAVGGARPDGDLDRLNLAATITDGERVLVPVVGQPLPEGDGAAGATDAAESGLLDLNLATAEQLEELPGIGPTLARAILDEREKRGRFQSIDDLKGVSGIGEKRFADIRDLVTVG